MSEEFIARLRGKRDYFTKRFLAPSGNAVFVTQGDADDFGEAADRLERAERVVEAARALNYVVTANGVTDPQTAAFESALRDYDTTRAPKSRTVLRREAAQRGEEPPEFTTRADTVRGEEAAGIEAVRRYRRERADQHVRGLNAEEEKK